MTGLSTGRRYIGLMSGTSLDGLDGVLIDIDDAGRFHSVASTSQPFDDALRAELLALNAPAENELHRSALVAQSLADLAGDVVADLLQQSALHSSDIAAIGFHGQTIRHRPELGYSLQIGDAARLAERTGIDVVSTVRAADIAAGGQGAPLAPVLHERLLRDHPRPAAMINIGGIANISYLTDDGADGFDCGPGNLLMDGWCQRHRQQPFDAGGDWAKSGRGVTDLLQTLLAEPFFQTPPPRSTGRDDFHLDWLDQRLGGDFRAVDVQATLCEFSARAIADSLRWLPDQAQELILCGGGARNAWLRQRIAAISELPVADSGEAFGVDPQQIEGILMAWLARCFIEDQPISLHGRRRVAGMLSKAPSPATRG